MKRVGLISIAVLSLLLGAATPAFSQQEQPDEKHGKPEGQAKPEPYVGASGGRDSFQVGQTAKARSGDRVQSLRKDATASVEPTL